MWKYLTESDQENTNGRNRPSGQIKYDRPGRPLNNLDAGKLPRWNLIICFPIEGSNPFVPISSFIWLHSDRQPV